LNELVIDCSAAIDLLGDGTSGTLPSATLYAPELIDLEFANVMRRFINLRTFAPGRADLVMDTWLSNDVLRCSHKMLFPRVWQLHDNFTPYDASYVALAEALNAPLLTADRRLAKAAEAHCEVILVGG
jgi:predicted nucleic acid-binding protein